jgi:DNA-binding response OmpR family regulator
MLNFERLYHEVVQERDELKEEVLRLREALGGSLPDFRFMRITSSEGKILHALLQTEMLTKGAILTTLYSGRAGDEPDQKIVDVFVCKLRKRLTPFGIEIGTVWGRGYFMDAENKAKIRVLEAREGIRHDQSDRRAQALAPL